MEFDFALYLTLAVIFTGAVSLFDRLFLRKRRQSNQSSLIVDYIRAFFTVLLVVWVVRSFILQPYRVPTASLAPTIMPGDFIAVKQFAYGLRIPVLNKKIFAMDEPQRGDIALFRWPRDPRIVFVKRVIGLPGDQVVYKNKVLYINGVKAQQKFLYKTYDADISDRGRLVYVKQENLLGVKHKMYVQSRGGEEGNYYKTVPVGHYFMMGDNRDNSDDSRQWGFVPEKNLIGKAFGIWMSWDDSQHQIRWHRIGRAL